MLDPKNLTNTTAGPSLNIVSIPISLPTWLTVEHDAAGLRRDISDLANRTEQTHDRATRELLEDLTQSYLRLAAEDVLKYLSEDIGMSWSDMALVLHVSVQAIRKWRLLGPISPDNQMALAQLAAFAHHLEGLGIADPDSWLRLPVISGYRPSRLDVYRGGDREALCSLAQGLVSPEQVMDLFDPEWREKLRLKNEVFRAADGHLSSRAKP